MNCCPNFARRDTAGTAALPAAKCRNYRRGSFVAFLQKCSSTFGTRVLIPPPNRCPIKFQIARLPIDIGAAAQKDLGMFRWQLLDQVNVGGVKYYVRQVAGSPKDQTGRVDPFKHQYALTVLLGGDAGLALNFRGNEHVPPSSHTDLWPDNCTDSRLLGLNLSAAGPSPTRYNREISECGRGA